MRIDLERYAPVGADGGREARGILLGLGLSAGFGLLAFLPRYFDRRAALYTRQGAQMVLRPGAVMEDFAQLLDWMLLGFAVTAVCMAALAVWHYASHFQGSRSIYTMRRLPQRWELARRCLTLPLLGALGCLIGAAALLLICFAVYNLATPEQCLTPHQWQKLWMIWMEGAL